MHALGLSLAQIMSQHRQNMKELAKCNERVTLNILLFFPNVQNICKKRPEELRRKHPSDSISVWDVDTCE